MARTVNWGNYRKKIVDRIYHKDKGHRWTKTQLRGFNVIQLENIAQHFWKSFKRKS